MLSYIREILVRYLDLQHLVPIGGNDGGGA